MDIHSSKRVLTLLSRLNSTLTVVTLSTSYAGLLYSSAGLGPAFGFMAGAAFLQIYIDAPSIQPPSASQLDVYSQSWLGAWWLGMVIFGVVACLPAIPVLFFPKRLPPCSDDGSESEKGVLVSLDAATVNTTAVSWNSFLEAD